MQIFTISWETSSPEETVCLRHLSCVSATNDHVEIAIDALQDIAVEVRGKIVAVLRGHYEQEVLIDFSALQDLCDTGHDKAILVLMQLQQRMVTLGHTTPVKNITPPLLDPSNAFDQITTTTSASCGSSDSSNTISLSVITSPDNINGTIQPVRNSMLPPSGPPTPPMTPHSPRKSSPPQSILSRLSTESGRSARRNVDPYKPVATTVIKTGLFGIGKRTKMERTASPPDNPLVGEYLADVLEGRTKRLSRSSSIRTANTSLKESDQTSCPSWQTYLSPNLDSLRGPAESTLSIESVRRDTVSKLEALTEGPPIHSIDPEDLLPNEMNKYAGFCKGAWRQQTGDDKRAMEERVRPGGMYNQAKYWQCKHCRFEGRSVPADKKKNGYDTRVFKLVDGIQFRWEFMFKSHIANKDSEPNPTKATFGCIFCCSEGKSTPHFSGIQSFMVHLGKHRKDLPTGEVLYRMNCLVGRQAAMGEDFDINLINLEESWT